MALLAQAQVLLHYKASWDLPSIPPMIYTNKFHVYLEENKETNESQVGLFKDEQRLHLSVCVQFGHCFLFSRLSLYWLKREYVAIKCSPTSMDKILSEVWKQMNEALSHCFLIHISV